MENNIDNETYEAMARNIYHGGADYVASLMGQNDEGDQDSMGTGANFIRNFVQNAIARNMEAAEAEERRRRGMPEWSRYYEFQDWLEKMKMGSQGGGMELGGANDMHIGSNDGVVEEVADVKMPADDANIEPKNKKAKNDYTMGEEQFGEEEDDNEIDDWKDGNLNLDDLHKDNNIQRQLDMLGPYLFGKKNMIELGYPTKLFWRALWSTEERHDVHFGAYRLRHFGRWDRKEEDVPVDDPWRWKTFGTVDGPSLALYFPGKNACHDAKSAWAGMVVEESEGNQLRPMFDTTWPRDKDIPNLDEVGDVISDILLACAPDELSVCLYIDRTMIDSFLAVATVQEEEERESESLGLTYTDSDADQQELNNRQQELEARRHNPGICSVSKFLSSPYLRDDSPITNISTSASKEPKAEQLGVFRSWLKNDSTAFGTLHREPILAKLPPKRYDKLTARMNRRSLIESEESKDDLVLLARRTNVPKDADTEKILEEMVQKLGLNSDIVTIQATRSRNRDIHSYAYLTRDEIGGNIHYPDCSIPLDDIKDDTDSSADGWTTSVSFTWTRTEKLTREHVKRQQYKQSFETDFVKRAEARKEASNGRITFILWPRERSGESDGYFSRDEPRPVTPENAHIIWLPGDYESMEEKAFDQFIGRDGGGGVIRFTNSHDGTMFWESVMAYFNHHVVNGHDACMLYEDSYGDGEEREYTTIPNEHCLKMLHLLVITRAFIIADGLGLVFDHEYPEEDIKSFFDKFCKAWHQVLLQTDDALGLGLIEDVRPILVSAATELGAHRSGAALNDLLDFQSLIEHYGPAHSRDGLHSLLESHGSWLERELNQWRHEVDFEISLVLNEEDIDIEEEEGENGEVADGEDQI